ncbi:MAG: hypothetical protein LBR83_01485, partial [Clostridiales bacterium]|nr:hypothetical protein [Clostridiales bacterium]
MKKNMNMLRKLFALALTAAIGFAALTPVTVTAEAYGTGNDAFLLTGAPVTAQAETTSPGGVIVGDYTVTFPDPEMERAIRLKLGKWDGDITQAEAASIKILEIQNSSLTDISGIEFCTGLAYLGIQGCVNFSDLSPLADAVLPNLTQLYLRENNIEDISPLSRANFPNLLQLELLERELSDLRPLVNAILPSLTHLVLCSNGITDISPLADVNFPYLEYLAIEAFGYSTPDPGLSDISPLAEANFPHLSQLHLVNNAISDLSPLKNFNFPYLDIINLIRNEIQDISPLAELNLPSLSKVWLDFNYLDVSSDSNTERIIRDLEAQGIYVAYAPRPNLIVTFPDPEMERAVREVLGKPDGDITQAEAASIRYLIIRNSTLTDISGIEFCTGLTRIFIDGCTNFSDLSPLSDADLPNLSSLQLSFNNIKDISPLSRANLPNLLDLWLSEVEISDLEPLVNVTFPKLTSLIISSNRITDIGPLADVNFPYLGHLVIDGLHSSGFSDISPLAAANFPHLSGLALRWNSISDLSPLANFNF